MLSTIMIKTWRILVVESEKQLSWKKYIDKWF